MDLEIIRHDAVTGKMVDSLPLHVAGRHVAEHCYEWSTGTEFNTACRKARLALTNKVVFRVGSYVYANRQLFNVPDRPKGVYNPKEVLEYKKNASHETERRSDSV